MHFEDLEKKPAFDFSNKMEDVRQKLMRLKVRKIFKVVFNLLSASGSDEETMPFS
jgi:hypothetical protein